MDFEESPPPTVITSRCSRGVAIPNELRYEHNASMGFKKMWDGFKMRTHLVTTGFLIWETRFPQ